MGDRYVHAPCVAYTPTFHHTSPILSLMYWKAQCMNALHTMHHHFLLFIITYVCIHRPGIPPPNYRHIWAYVPVYKSHLQDNAYYLHCACVWECTTHWHTVSGLIICQNGCVYNFKKRVKTRFPYKQYYTASSIVQE